MFLIGFDVNIAGTAAGHPGSYLAKDRYRSNPNDTLWAVRGLDKYIDQGLNLTEALTREAIATLEANKKNGMQMAGQVNYKTIQKIAGESIIPFLHDQSKKDNEKVLLWHYPNN